MATAGTVGARVVRRSDSRPGEVVERINAWFVMVRWDDRGTFGKLKIRELKLESSRDIAARGGR